MRGSIPFSGAKIIIMKIYEIELLKNIEKQTKLLESIAKSLKKIANEQESKSKEYDK